MRVLFLNFEYPPIGGGGANATRNILNEFKNFADLKVDLITSGTDQSDCIIKLSNNIFIHRLSINKKNLHYWTNFEIITSIYRSYFYTRQILTKHHYDLIHTFFTIPGGIVSLPFSKKIPVIISIRGTDVPGFNPRYSWLYPFIKPLVRYIWRHAKMVISNSEGLRDLAHKTFSSGQIIIIPNGVYPIIKDISERNISFTPPYKFLTVARLIRRKNIHILIESLARCLNDGLEFHLDVIGDGDQKKWLEAQTINLGLGDYITFHGYIEHDGISEYYKNADIFILPSMNEGMSNTVLEAIGAGLPLIVSNTGGTRELVDNNGIVVDDITPEHIYDAIKRITSSKNTLIAYSRSSLKKASKFTWQNVAKGYIRCYNDALVSHH